MTDWLTGDNKPNSGSIGDQKKLKKSEILFRDVYRALEMGVISFIDNTTIYYNILIEHRVYKIEYGLFEMAITDERIPYTDPIKLKC